MKKEDAVVDLEVDDEINNEPQYVRNEGPTHVQSVATVPEKFKVTDVEMDGTMKTNTVPSAEEENKTKEIREVIEEIERVNKRRKIVLDEHKVLDDKLKVVLDEHKVVQDELKVREDEYKFLMDEQELLLKERKGLLDDRERLLKDIKEKKDETKSKSLYASIVGKYIEKLKLERCKSSNDEPNEYSFVRFWKKEFELTDLIAPGTLEKKRFTLPDLIAAVDELKVEADKDPELETIVSGLMLKFLSAFRERSFTYNYAAVKYHVTTALDDATWICNALINMVVDATDSTESKKKIGLYTEHEMSIFSNRSDHLVVYNSTTNTPIFCVETKYYFDDTFQDEIKNQSLGQCFDQLKAMQLMGHPIPLGALTCFNETYLTSLSPDIEWDTPPTLQSLQGIVARLPGIAVPSNDDPSSLTTEGPNCSPIATAGFVGDTTRSVFRSDVFIKQDKIVSAFVIHILQALKGFYIPKPFQRFSNDNQPIEVDCIQMTNTAYQ